MPMNDDCLGKIWYPNLIFKEAKDSKKTGDNDFFFQTFPLLQIYLSRRYSSKVSCKMHFGRYPFDEQHCLFSIQFKSPDDMFRVLRWSNDERNPRSEWPALSMVKDIEPLQYMIGTPTTHVLKKDFGFFSVPYLQVNITLTRRWTASIVNYYLPSGLLVVVSWVSFWLREEATAERVTLIMTSLLTLCTQGNSYKSELPTLNYITAMDIWYFVCTTMVFAALLEFAISYNAFINRNQRIAMIEKRERENCSKIDSPEATAMATLEERKDAEEIQPNSPKMISKISNCLRTRTLDSVCKVIFPAFFLAFNVVYWSFYTDSLWF